MAEDDDAAKTDPPEAPDKPGEPALTDAPEESAAEVEYLPVEPEDPPAAEASAAKDAKAHGGSEKPLKGKLKAKDEELKALQAERDEIQDKYLRKLAEMDNLRKRFERDRNDYLQYALSDFLKELLGVLDNFERALENRQDAGGEGFFEGVKMIHRQYLELLQKKGVRPVEPKDQSFDPAVQQAVLTEESEAVDEPVVAEELQRGYLLNDRLLRPALVKVLVPKKADLA